MLISILYATAHAMRAERDVKVVRVWCRELIEYRKSEKENR